MVIILFESHGTTLDNERKLASGWHDAGLSQLGIQQAQDLGKRYEGMLLHTIFCSDLQRSYQTAEVAFGMKYLIIQDARLRECDYGDMTLAPKGQVEAYKTTALRTPYPNGESYAGTAKRMKTFLRDVIKQYNGKTIMIIGHRATQYGLEHWVNGVPLNDAVLAPWHWQPGWRYELRSGAFI